MKKIILAFSLMLLILTVSASAEEKVTMYAKDGRTAYISASAVEDWENQGWKEGITLYAADGRKKVSNPFKVDIEAERRVGWYADKSEVTTKVFLQDGTFKEVFIKQVSSYESQGWKKGVTLYAADGRTKISNPFTVDFEAEKNVGWYSDKSEVTKVMFAKDGTKKEVFLSQFEEYTKLGWKEAIVFRSKDGRVKYSDPNKVNISAEIKVGWYPDYVLYNAKGEKMTVEYLKIYHDEETANRLVQEGWKLAITVYAADGRSKVISPYNAEAEEKVGWYADLSKVQTMLYALGTDDYYRTKWVFNSEVDYYISLGWSRYPLITVYSLDGRTKQIAKEQLEANEKVGWYSTPPVTLYAMDGRTKVVPEEQVEANKKVGWYDNINDVQITMYAKDGRTKKVFKARVDAEKAVGWYDEPLVKLYAMDGRTTQVVKSQVEAYEKVGWYTWENAHIDVYSFSGTKTILKSEISKYAAQGYSTVEPPFQVQPANTGWVYDGYYRWPKFYVSKNRIYCRLPMISNRTKGKAISRVDFQIKYLDGNGNGTKISTGKTYSNHTVYVYAAYNTYHWYYGTPLGFGSDMLGGYIEEFTAPNYIHRIQITNFKVHFTDGTTASVAGSVELFNEKP